LFDGVTVGCFPEEAVNEVKRQAVAELQKAVQAAEAKAAELVAAERAKMERALSDARKQAREEVLSQMTSQEESSEVRLCEDLSAIFVYPLKTGLITLSAGGMTQDVLSQCLCIFQLHVDDFSRSL
jgi:CHAT domain-containing protein